ncbi:hypothetical protein M1446_05300 [Candidatus Dependentiae bacterium]|nr:hypothetical protein [Candidatus Dependentiae bacterium]
MITKNFTAKKILFLSTCIIFLSFAAYFYAKKRNNFLDFYQSMTDREIIYGVHSTPEAEKDWMVILKALYDKNHFTAVDYQRTEFKIPPIIHHIWLGSEMPQAYKEIRETWFEHHPEFIFKLWDDSQVEPFGLENKNLYDLARNYGEKSDVFRYEILRRYGGTYSDTDVFCLKPFNVLHSTHDFYTGIMNAGEVLVAIGVLGSAPNYPFLDSVIRGIEDKGSKYDTVSIMERTGPIHFTKVFVKVAPSLQGNIIAYPATYFYPVPNLIRGSQCQQNAHKFIKPESFTVHYWECSWMHPHAFQIKKIAQSENSYFHKEGIDKFLDEHFENKKSGTFVDINCTDYVEKNISLFFEKNRNWSGICTQPKMNIFKRIANNRNSFCTRCSLNGGSSGLKNYNLHELLNLCKFEKIDLLCLQSENAYEILKNINYNKAKIDVLCIKTDDITKIKELLLSRHFHQIKNINDYWIFKANTGRYS